MALAIAARDRVDRRGALRRFFDRLARVRFRLRGDAERRQRQKESES